MVFIIFTKNERAKAVVNILLYFMKYFYLKKYYKHFILYNVYGALALLFLVKLFLKTNFHAFIIIFSIFELSSKT